MQPTLSPRLSPPALAPRPATASTGIAGAFWLAAMIPAQAPVDANHAGAAAPVAANPGSPSQGSPGSSLLPLWTDDFNRPDSTNMGPDWTEVQGDEVILSNHGQGNLITGWSYMLHNFAAQSPASAVMEIDLLPPSGTSGPHVALIAGAATGSVLWFYTKIQDNNSDGTYDRIYFYSNGNGGSWGTNASVPLTTPIATGRVYMYFTNAGDTLHVDIDTDFNGVVDQSYANTGALAVTVAGTSFGIGTWAMGSYDNWRVNDSLPATVQTYGAGCPGTGGTAPAIGATGLPQIGNVGFAITVQNGLPTSIGLVAAGSAAASIPFGACTVLVAPPWVTAAVALDVAGAGSAPLPIPNIPSLHGAQLYAQCLVVDPNGAFLNFASLSNGLSMVVGY